MKTMRSVLACVALGATLPAAAQYIPPELLRTTTDGAGRDVQSMIDATAGLTANVGRNDNTSYGDQMLERVFIQDGASMTWDYKWSNAGLAGQHRLGWYSLNDPSRVNWVLGNVNRDGRQVSSWTGSISGMFGMVLDNGIGDLFYSEPGRNRGTPLNSNNNRLNGFDRRNQVAVFQNRERNSILLSWEDLRNVSEASAGGTLDYNDYGYEFRSTKAVPEPGTMLGLAAAGAAVALKRRRRKSAPAS